MLDGPIGRVGNSLDAQRRPAGRRSHLGIQAKRVLNQVWNAVVIGISAVSADGGVGQFGASEIVLLPDLIGRSQQSIDDKFVGGCGGIDLAVDDGGGTELDVLAERVARGVLLAIPEDLRDICRIECVKDAVAAAVGCYAHEETGPRHVTVGGQRRSASALCLSDISTNQRIGLDHRPIEFELSHNVPARPENDVFGRWPVPIDQVLADAACSCGTRHG